MSGYPLSPLLHPTLENSRIRPYVTSESNHLITALRKILSKLELTEVDGRDQEPFAELKRILTQRIQVLENCTAIPSPSATTANNSD